jgi:hypothetical protein
MPRLAWGVLTIAAMVACGGATTTPGTGVGEAGSDAGAGGSSGGGSSGASSSSSGGTSSGAPGDGAAGCTVSGGCGTGQICGFPTGEGCSGRGTCFPAPGVTCLAYSAGCACDGTEINVACTGLPGGYVTQPLLHTGVCGQVDAGGACTSDTQCAPGLKCCYPCGVAGCTNQCITPLSSGTCPMYP